MTKETDIEYALWCWRQFGDLSSFLRAIRSDRPLTAGDRNLIADYIEGKIERPAIKPPLAYLRDHKSRSRLLPIEAAAGEFKRQREDGVKREDAIAKAVAYSCPPEEDPSAFEERLETWLRRSKRNTDPE